MGNAKFYYNPSPDSSQLVTIDLGEPLAELFSDFEVDASTGVTMSGRMRRVTGLQREIVTIQRDRLSGGESLGHQFAALQNHLDRGGAVAFASDSEKAWAAPVLSTPSAGDTRIETGPNPFSAIVGNNLPSADDYVVLETMPPAMLHEIRQIKSVSSLSATASGSFDISNSAPTQSSTDGTAFTYNNSTFARYYRFWPILRRPQSDIGQSLITNESGILWSLSVRLVVDYDVLFSYHPNDTDPFPDQFVGELVPPEIMTDTSYQNLNSPRQKIEIDPGPISFDLNFGG